MWPDLVRLANLLCKLKLQRTPKSQLFYANDAGHRRGDTRGGRPDRLRSAATAPSAAPAIPTPGYSSPVSHARPPLNPSQHPAPRTSVPDPACLDFSFRFACITNISSSNQMGSDGKFGRGPRELGGAVDLISCHRLLNHHSFFCKKPLPLAISDTHYLSNVVGDTEIRKGEGMELDQLFENSYQSEKASYIQPFDMETLGQAFQLREATPVDLPSAEKGIPTISGKSKTKSKDKVKKHKKHKEKDSDKEKEQKKHKHRHKERSKDKDKDKKKDRSGNHDLGGDHSKKHEKKRKQEGSGNLASVQNNNKTQKHKKNVKHEMDFIN